jgi:hypothetical protein
MVLFKLNPGVTDDQLAELRKYGEEMVGQIPGMYDRPAEHMTLEGLPQIHRAEVLPDGAYNG